MAETSSSDLNDEDAINLGNTYLYHQLDEYPWATDQEFQGGLRAILGSSAHQDPAQVDHLTLRAKCYYFARKAGTPVDFDGYKRWVEVQRGTAAGNSAERPAAATAPAVSGDATTTEDGTGGGGVGGMGSAPKPASFAEICEMINEGKPIPGIKEIPDTVLEGQASERQTQRRRKPWERKEEGEDASSVDGGETQTPSWLK